MTTWNLSKQRDNREPLNVNVKFYSIVFVLGKPTLVFSNQSDYAPIAKSGRLESFLAFRSGRFVPGSFKIGPCVAQRNDFTSSGGIATVGEMYQGKLLGTRVISGDIAAGVFGGYNSQPTYLSTIDDSANHHFVLNAVGKSRESQILIANTIAEAPETLSMLSPAIKAFKQKAKKLSPPKTLRRFGSVLDYASSAWLSVRYGVIPTMKDIDAIREIYDKKVNPQLEFGGILKSKTGKTAKSFVGQQQFVRKTFGNVYVFGFDNATLEHTITACAYSRNRLSKQRMIGLDVRSILLSGYEGVPYSFVLDWFVDVGGWMAASIPSSEVKDLGNCLSFKQTHRTNTAVTGACYVQVPSATYPLVQASSVATLSTVTYQRSTNVPIPELPQVNVDLQQLTRKLDGLSLAWQQVGKLLPRR